MLNIEISKKAKIVKRVNKYVVEVDIDNKVEFAHLHDPGRLIDLIYPGNDVLLADKSDNPNRKTKWEILASLDSEDIFVLTNTVYHNKLIKEWLLENKIVGENVKNIKAEKRFGDSRFDFFITLENGQDWWVEVKGVTYKEGKVAMFPDAPTKRGQKHISHLIEMKKNSINTMIIFAVFTSHTTDFKPNQKIDPIFSNLFYEAVSVGVKILPLQFELKENSLRFVKKLNIV